MYLWKPKQRGTILPDSAHISDDFLGSIKVPIPDNFIPVVPVDYEYHTDNNAFCWDEDCPCHTDKQAIATVKNQYEDGLLTAQEAEWTIKGKTL